MSIKIVTDSTCDIPKALVEQYDITVVPSYVNIGDQSYLDGIDISRDEFYDNLPHYKHHPTSAAPSPAVFTQAYEDAAERGATEVLAIHVSSTFSSFLNNASLGAEATDKIPVTMFDSQQLTMALGFQVLTAARMAEAGESMDNITAYLNQLRPHCHTYCMVESLDSLRRGGRVNWLQMGVSSLLNIKPIIHVYEGEVLQATRVRTRKKAIAKMIELAADSGPITHVALLNSNSDDYEDMQALMMPHIPAEAEVVRTVACPAIGVHVGAKALGVVVVTAV
ncbi:MAG: DegV family protein [Anaerolineales bacterium]|nr:DegV family protein [Anaerolineales bacterium]